MLKCWRTYTPHTLSLRTNSSQLRGSACPGSESGDHPGTAKCPEPLCPHVGVTAFGGRRPAPPRRALPLLHRSYGLMRQTTALRPPPVSLVRPVCAGCCQPLLRSGSSRRYLCQSFLTCLDPYPGCLQGAYARFFPWNIGLPQKANGSAQDAFPTAISVGYAISGLQSFHNVQAHEFAHLTDSSHPRYAMLRVAGRPRLLRPRISRLVAFPVQWLC